MVPSLCEPCQCQYCQFARYSPSSAAASLRCHSPIAPPTCRSLATIPVSSYSTHFRNTTSTSNTFQTSFLLHERFYTLHGLYWLIHDIEIYRETELLRRERLEHNLALETLINLLIDQLRAPSCTYHIFNLTSSARFFTITFFLRNIPTRFRRH